MTKSKKGLNPTQVQAPQTAHQAASTVQDEHSIPMAPLVTGQCAEILSILRQGPTLSLTLTADHAIPETAARIHDLREKGFNIGTQIQDSVIFRGRERRGVALYVLGHPEWPRSGFQMPEPVNSLPID